MEERWFHKRREDEVRKEGRDEGQKEDCQALPSQNFRASEAQRLESRQTPPLSLDNDRERDKDRNKGEKKGIRTRYDPAGCKIEDKGEGFFRRCDTWSPSPRGTDDAA